MRRSLRSIHPRTVLYNTDGSGRDLYISFNNGGMTKSDFWKFPIASIEYIEYRG